jgi:hypothetical protein
LRAAALAGFDTAFAAVLAGLAFWGAGAAAAVALRTGAFSLTDAAALAAGFAAGFGVFAETVFWALVGLAEGFFTGIDAHSLSGWRRAIIQATNLPSTPEKAGCRRSPGHAAGRPEMLWAGSDSSRIRHLLCLRLPLGERCV